MASWITLDNLVLVIGLLGTIFGVYSYFRNPQIDLDKRQAVDQVEVDGKAQMLAQQVQWEKEVNSKRFAEMGESITTAMTLAQNHIHTVDTKVDGLSAVVAKLSNDITRLSTIIDERIPKKAV